MKWLLLLSLAFSSAAFAGIKLQCIEYTESAPDEDESEYSTYYADALRLLNEGQPETIEFNVIVDAKRKGCYQVVEEITRHKGQVTGREVMSLVIDKSAGNCVYSNAGNSSFTYGFVCKRK